MKYYTLKVISIRSETDDALTIVFKQPALKKINYKAGQYLTLIFRINGRRYIRPYSFSSAPGIDAGLEITVKRVPGGVVSNHIIDTLRIDDLVEVMEPIGDFTLPADLPADTHLVLWGAGSGITPLMSIIKYALHQQNVQHVTLVYGNRSGDSTIFAEQIRQLQLAYPQFTVWHFHTSAVINLKIPAVIIGRIAPEKVLKVMEREGHLQQTIHYICGPEGLKQSVKESLTDMGILSNKIFTEDFEIVRNPADFVDVITRNVFVNKNGERSEVEVIKGKSILEAGLDALLELNYSCQTGNCVVCKGRLLSGEVKMIGATERPVALNDDECLLCCSFPVTDNVEIVIE